MCNAKALPGQCALVAVCGCCLVAALQQGAWWRAGQLARHGPSSEVQLAASIAPMHTQPHIAYSNFNLLQCNQHQRVAVGLTCACVVVFGLAVLCLQAMLQVRSLRHLSGLAALQELVVQPRGYIK